MKWLAEFCGTCDMTANLQFMKENLKSLYKLYIVSCNRYSQCIGQKKLPDPHIVRWEMTEDQQMVNMLPTVIEKLSFAM